MTTNGVSSPPSKTRYHRYLSFDLDRSWTTPYRGIELVTPCDSPQPMSCFFPVLTQGIKSD